MRLRAQTGVILLAVVTATITEGQNTPSQQLSRQRTQIHGNTAGAKPSAGITPPSITSPPEAPPTAQSLLDQPAAPAQVQLDAGKLLVKADNSTLSEILHDISARTGMTVDGLSRDQRIFGSYGPAAPREVLSALLDGLGYNVMMVGSLDNGAPRALNLSPRSSGGTTNSPVSVARQINNSDDDDDSASETQDTPMPPRPEPNPADANQPPEQQQQPLVNPNQPGQVKTPQQMLQELQQMRQQQMQQQQQVAPQ